MRSIIAITSLLFAISECSATGYARYSLPPEQLKKLNELSKCCKLQEAHETILNLQKMLGDSVDEATIIQNFSKTVDVLLDAGKEIDKQKPEKINTALLAQLGMQYLQLLQTLYETYEKLKEKLISSDLSQIKGKLILIGLIEEN